MGNTIDVIKGLIIRRNITRNKDKRLTNQIMKQLKTYFDNIMSENDDFVFKDLFIKLINSDVVKPYIVSDFFPVDMNQYAKRKSIISFTNDFRFELRWIIYCIKYYKDEISSFLSEREKYDNYILLNKYEEALGVVDSVERNIGVSLWSMECKFFLYVKLNKDSAELLKEVPETVYRAILNFYELKNRDNVTSEEYFYIVSKEISSQKRVTSGHHDVIEFYKYHISSLVYQGDQDDIMLIMSGIRRSSLVDKYLFFIDLCNYSISQSRGNYVYKTVQNYIQELDGIKDDHLIALRFVFDSNENRMNSYLLKARLDNAKSNFVKGNLTAAREEAIQLLKLYPNNTEATNLFIESNILINDELVVFEDTNLGILINKLTSVYTMKSDRDDSQEEINKLANACSRSSWAQSILNSVLFRCQEYNQFVYKRANILSNIQHLDIETMISCLDTDECIQFIDEKLNNDDSYVKFRKAIIKKNFKEASELCEIKQIRDLLVIYDNNNTIEQKMAHLRKIEGKDASMAIMGMKYFLSTINLDEHIDIAMNLATDLIINNIYTSLFIPLEKIVSYIDNGDLKIRKNICSPILYYVYAYYFDREKIDDLGIICEDFFLFENIEKPSKMGMLSEKYGKERLIYFLKNVCYSKVLDSSVNEIINTQERDTERVEICNVLSQLDVLNLKVYEKEIREITQKLMINAELKTIEENRIHVNVDGMKDRLEKSFKNDFLRYKFYQDERYIQWTLVLDGENNEKFLAIKDAPERILKELVFHIRDAFVSSDEYGLNGYLSLNIRHGTLEDELRSPLFKALLTAKKDVNTNKYTINPHWLNYVSNIDIKIIENSIINFHFATETIIKKLKGKYIQIRTEEKETEGLFDYRLYEGDMLEIAISADLANNFDEFLDIVINYLWTITEKNLCQIKQIIKSEIIQDYHNAFEDLKNSIVEISNKSVLRELQQKINEAATDMPNVLYRICYWFQRSTESKHNDFDLSFAFNMGLQTIKNMHPEKKFIANEKEKTISDKIPGAYLKSFDGIFYNLLDNIYKKANAVNGSIEIRHNLRYENGIFYIYIENDFDCSDNILDEKARVAEAKHLIRTGEYLKRVKGEGGTGIPKICKIIMYDLKLQPLINFDYIENEDKFFMEIIF
jgi:hypothetical protein